ncbi:cytochrome P450 [Svornostia abyssi]|uniref:Cytochrome P450 n=1 Tax=Svornostia abyssi TaxID=2898438 RepID=A0ABY5PKI8_9ACTN|nr:cytochrome P450 [Parviterribacteraceae bacterium J379]
MTATASAPRVTPTTSGIRVAQSMLLSGLISFNQIAEKASEADIVRWRSGPRQVFAITHPDYIEHVLRKHADRYMKSVEYQLVSTVLGRSLFTDDGETWQRHRTMLNPFFSRRQLNGMIDLMVDPIERYVADLDSHGDGFELEMVSDMTMLTLDVVGTALFGRELGSVAKTMGHAVTTGLRLGEVAARLTLVAAPPAWAVRLLGHTVHYAPLLPPPLDRAQFTMRAIDRMVDDVLESREADDESVDLLGMLLRARDQEGTLTTQRVRDEAVTFMIAGHETTANGMAWMWYLLALNGWARERMLEEVDTVLGGRTPTAKDVPLLPWTSACFQEALRYFSPIWVVPRTAIVEDEIDGHRIPKGSTVLVPVNAVHHDPRFWDDPQRFDPTRFLPEHARDHHRFAYLPFGAGQRICIGRTFALMEATLIAAMMSQRFAFEAVPGHPVEPEATLTLRPRRGVRMIARRRP